MISVCPYFEVPEDKMQEFRAVFQDFYNRTQTETEVLFCGFTRGGNCFSCREAYCSAQGALAHMKNVAGPMSVAGKYMKSMAIHGPQAELDKFKEANIPATYWVSTGGFSRIHRPGVPLASKVEKEDSAKAEPTEQTADVPAQAATEAAAEEKHAPIPDAEVVGSPRGSPDEGAVLAEVEAEALAAENELEQEQTCKDASESIPAAAKVPEPATSAPPRGGVFGGCFGNCSNVDNQLEIKTDQES